MGKENKNELTRTEKYNGFLDFIATKLQVKINSSSYLGYGMSGEVHDIGNGRILKLTTSNIDESYKVVNKNIDGICKVYSIGEIEIPKRYITKAYGRYYIYLKNSSIRTYYKNITIYYIIMEKLNAKKAEIDLDFYIDDLVENYFDYNKSEVLKYNNITDYKSNLHNGVYIINELKNNDDFLEKLIIFASNNYFQKNIEVEKFYDILSELFKIFKNVGKIFKWIDIHKGQFGYDKKGNLKAFDIDSKYNVDLEHDHTKSRHLVRERKIRTFESFNTKNTFEILNGTRWTYDKIVNDVNKSFSDETRSKEDVDFYLTELEKLQKNGGLIYRIVFLYDINKFDKDKIGEHWTIDIYNIDNIADSLKDGAMEFDEFDEFDELYSDGNSVKKPYLITAKIAPQSINLDWSISQFTELPYELEVNLSNQPIDYKIEEYDKNKPKHVVDESKIESFGKYKRR